MNTTKSRLNKLMEAYKPDGAHAGHNSVDNPKGLHTHPEIEAKVTELRDRIEQLERREGSPTESYNKIKGGMR